MSIDWVAEIGSSHKGNKALAHELIRQASMSGATVSKFQLGWTQKAQEAAGLVYNPIRFVDEWVADLSAWCRQCEVEFMASVWSDEGIEAGKSVNMKRYKIAYSQRNNTSLMSRVFSLGKSVFVSGGQWTMYGTPIWCVSKYPTYPEDLTEMPERFGKNERWYGYSDHAHGVGACLLAVARGAKYIEKHFALDKTDLATKDTPFSATPDEFAEMVRVGKEVERYRNEIEV